LEARKHCIFAPQFNLNCEDAYNYIARKSIQNAEKLQKEIGKAVDYILKYPEANPPEKFSHSRNNSIRFKIVMKRYKIIFEVLPDKVVFLCLFHTSQHPGKLGNIKTDNFD
jgi:plasmid stabilization system protein ParE